MAALNLASDYEIFDGLEAVTFKRVTDGSVASSTAIASALRMAITRQSNQLTAAGLSLEPGDLAFHLPAELLGAEKPKPGDLIEDASGVVYTILASTKATLGTRYACVCRERRV